ncbi:hypothetical protein L873DRAFT_1830383 [Choiromyces venosus 120613-1]|uniref:MARVEL domain-containing protein n=1 Tax=Choiromyces venosus 120613-1 TaxID=1336337 RepID=A0A3N4J7N1_9PEZI|nr:hypothetical protein L873DRAFT_1830383 [Choiromyces venosus 120613-1]
MKTLTWLIRLFQFFFAIILVGVLSYMIDQFRHYNYSAPREVIVPEVFSVLALVTTFFSILSVFFLGYTLQLVAAFFDFVLFAGYLASAILLRHNYHNHSWRNPLRNTLIVIRTANGDSSHHMRNSGLVRLLVALVVIQVFLFFITTILSVLLARRTDRERGLGEKRRGAHVTV